MPDQGTPEDREPRDRSARDWEFRELVKKVAALESFKDIWGTRLSGFMDAQNARHKETQFTQNARHLETQNSIKELAAEVGSLKSVRDKMLGLAVLWPIIVMIIGGLALVWLTPKEAPKIHPEMQTFFTKGLHGETLSCTWSNAGEAQPYCTPIDSGGKQ